MQRLILMLVFLVCTTILWAQTNPNHVYVEGYTRSDGTYVKGHYRTAPNSTNRDNFSTRGNSNPYTGKPGWVTPDNSSSTGSSNSYSTTTSSSSLNSTQHSSETNTPGFLTSTNSTGQTVLTYLDGRVVFGLCENCQNVTYDEEKEYYWYNSYSGIQKTEGGSGGKLLHGEYMVFYKSGQIMVKAYYKNGLEDGDYTIWDEEGSLEGKMHFNDGVVDYRKVVNEDGSVSEWDGELFSIGSFIRIYGKSGGTLLKEIEITPDYRFHHKFFDDWTGQLESEYTQGLSGDYYFGPFTEYYKSGQVKFQGYFTDSFRDSTWVWYDEEGNIKTTNRYRVHKEYYSDGKLKVQGSQLLSDITGEWESEDRWVYYKPDGESWLDVKYFEQGMLVEKKEEESK